MTTPFTKHPTDRDSLELNCEVTFFRASGPGGQHRNKRETGVRLVHHATRVVVTATERRSQSQNRELAFARMAARLQSLQVKRKPRKPSKPSRGAIERRLKAKKQQAQKKANRRHSHDD